MNRNVYKSGARQVVFNVFQECLAEFKAGKFRSELDDVYVRTAKLTGVSVSTVRRIVDEGFKTKGKLVTPGKNRQGRPKKEIDDFDICAISKGSFFYTVQKEVPTLRKLLTVVKADLNFDGSHKFLRQIQISIGFKFKKCQASRQALIEKPAIASKREFYLKQILDKCWQSINMASVEQNINKSKRWTIVHAGSRRSKNVSSEIGSIGSETVLSSGTVIRFIWNIWNTESK